MLFKLVSYYFLNNTSLLFIIIIIQGKYAVALGVDRNSPTPKIGKIAV